MSIAGPLLDWYRRHRRTLPWREDPEPYGVWISEAMLQQTQVATVIPYFERFLRRFPTVNHLAAAPLEDVLKAWEGLGYYSRARNLHRAAGEVVARFGGELPADAIALRSLPGIGPYMAGAVASIAFGLPEPLLDGNVERVFTRLYAIGDPLKAPDTQRRLWGLAAEHLPPGSPGDYNQALMELGAVVCRPKSPDCGACPLADPCRARAVGDPEAYPFKPKRKATPHHDIAVGVVTHGERVLLVRRPESGLLGGLWEFPGGRCVSGEAPEVGVRRQLRERFGVEVAVGGILAPVAHAFTHRRVTLHPYRCDADHARVAPAYHVEHRWVALGEVPSLPLPRAHQKILAGLAVEAAAHG